MNNGNLSPDTNLALLTAAQGNVEQNKQLIKDTARAKEIQKATEAARDFEALFVAEMMKPMFEGIKTDGMFGGGKGEEVFRSMLVQEYGKIISQTGQVGISDQVREEMIKMQGQIDGTLEE